MLILLALVLAAVTYFLRREQRRLVRSSADMVALLPKRDMITVFVDAGVLRQAKLLTILQGSGAVADGDYQRFVRNTGFDYTKNVEALAARGNQQQIFMVVRGSFDWTRLREYAGSHGGGCNTAFCKVPTSQSGRWASFLQIQPDMMGLAVSTDPADVLLLSPRRVEGPPEIPPQPVWVTLPHSALADPQIAASKSIPLPLHIFALTIQAAESATLSIGPGAPDAADYQLRLDATFQNAAGAESTRNQLEIDTKMLKIELEREHQKPSRSDLTGLLTGGTFYQSGNSVIGQWPVHTELLKSLQ